MVMTMRFLFLYLQLYTFASGTFLGGGCSFLQK